AGGMFLRAVLFGVVAGRLVAGVPVLGVAPLVGLGLPRLARRLVGRRVRLVRSRGGMRVRMGAQTTQDAAVFERLNERPELPGQAQAGSQVRVHHLYSLLVLCELGAQRSYVPLGWCRNRATGMGKAAGSTGAFASGRKEPNYRKLGGKGSAGAGRRARGFLLK